jgi:ribosomal protein S14
MTRYDPNVNDPVYGDVDSREKADSENEVGKYTDRCADCGKMSFNIEYGEDGDLCRTCVRRNDE